MSKPGHNSGVAGAHLRSFVERIERLEEDRASIGADIREVYAEAKGVGFDVKALRIIVRERREDADKLAERKAVLEIYRAALGDFAETDLGKAGEPR